MEIYSSYSGKINLSWWQIKKIKQKMKKSYQLADSLKKLAYYMKKWEEKKAEQFLEKNLKNI